MDHKLFYYQLMFKLSDEHVNFAGYFLATSCSVAVCPVFFLCDPVMILASFFSSTWPQKDTAAIFSIYSI